MAELTDPEMLARLRVAALSGYLTPDLGRWAVAWIAERIADRDVEAMRNICLRRAAERLPGGPWAQARHLAREVARARAVGPLAGAWPPNGTPAGEVAAALLLDPECPATPRHLLRVLSRCARHVSGPVP
jgi:hypothetical protein